jgi:hypothetical protein
MLFSFRSYGSETDIIDEIQFLSRQRSEISVRKPVLYLYQLIFLLTGMISLRSAVDNLSCCKEVGNLGCCCFWSI